MFCRRYLRAAETRIAGSDSGHGGRRGYSRASAGVAATFPETFVPVFICRICAVQSASYATAMKPATAPSVVMQLAEGAGQTP